MLEYIQRVNKKHYLNQNHQQNLSSLMLNNQAHTEIMHIQLSMQLMEVVNLLIQTKEKECDGKLTLMEPITSE